MRGTGSRVKKKSKPPDQKEQSQRFVETARQLEADESGQSFERAIVVIAPRKKSTKNTKTGSRKS